jgi:hypothetical protein
MTQIELQTMYTNERKNEGKIPCGILQTKITRAILFDWYKMTGNHACKQFINRLEGKRGENTVPYFANKNKIVRFFLTNTNDTSYLSLASLGIMGEGAPSFSQCVGLER